MRREGVHKTDVHMQVTVLVEAREAEGDPIFAAPAFEAASFEEHVEDELQVAGMKRMPSWADNADKSTTGHDEAIQEGIATLLKKGVVDHLSV